MLLIGDLDVLSVLGDLSLYDLAFDCVFTCGDIDLFIWVLGWWFGGLIVSGWVCVVVCLAMDYGGSVVLGWVYLLGGLLFAFEFTLLQVRFVILCFLVFDLGGVLLLILDV